MSWRVELTGYQDHFLVHLPTMHLFFSHLLSSPITFLFPPLYSPFPAYSLSIIFPLFLFCLHHPCESCLSHIYWFKFPHHFSITHLLPFHQPIFFFVYFHLHRSLPLYFFSPCLSYFLSYWSPFSPPSFAHYIFLVLYHNFSLPLLLSSHLSSSPQWLSFPSLFSHISTSVV